MIINGEEYKTATPITLQDLLQQRGWDLNRVAVELNGNVVSKQDYALTNLSESDKLEIVSFVGGG